MLLDDLLLFYYPYFFTQFAPIQYTSDFMQVLCHNTVNLLTLK